MPQGAGPLTGVSDKRGIPVGAGMTVAGAGTTAAQDAMARENLILAVISAHFRSLKWVKDISRGDPEGSVPCRTLRLEEPGGWCQLGDVMGRCRSSLGRLSFRRRGAGKTYGEWTVLHSTWKWASVGMQSVPLMGTMSWGQVEKAMTQSISALSST